MPMVAKMLSTAGSCLSRLVMFCTTAVVCSIVEPGCSSTEIIERPRSVAAMNSVGSFVASAIEPAKKAMPANSVIQRWSSALRNSHR
ncbi:hypothetical protein AJ88_26755 [Mesorhizobium amorphae CCBAU 01583]|nr:hypothetical protein AJ88_26755 [Mesorhizobium amorphae CCBAU 01583]